MRDALADEYRSARQAQIERFESACPGVDITDTHTREFQEYFGQGEFAGHGVERALTFRTWLAGQGAEERAWNEELQRRADEAEAWATRQADKARAYFAELAAADRYAIVSTITLADAFRMRRPELDQLAADGCRAAVAELDRRAAKRAARVTS